MSSFGCQKSDFEEIVGDFVGEKPGQFVNPAAGLADTKAIQDSIFNRGSRGAR